MENPGLKRHTDAELTTAPQFIKVTFRRRVVAAPLAVPQVDSSGYAGVPAEPPTVKENVMTPPPLAGTPSAPPVAATNGAPPILRNDISAQPQRNLGADERRIQQQQQVGGGEKENPAYEQAQQRIQNRLMKRRSHPLHQGSSSDVNEDRAIMDPATGEDVTLPDSWSLMETDHPLSQGVPNLDYEDPQSHLHSLEWQGSRVGWAHHHYPMEGEGEPSSHHHEDLPEAMECASGVMRDEPGIDAASWSPHLLHEGAVSDEFHGEWDMAPFEGAMGNQEDPLNFSSGPSIHEVDPRSPQYDHDYDRGWKASGEYSEDRSPLEEMDNANASHAAYDGYMDYAVGRRKYHLRAVRRLGLGEPNELPDEHWDHPEHVASVHRGAWDKSTLLPEGMDPELQPRAWHEEDNLVTYRDPRYRPTDTRGNETSPATDQAIIRLKDDVDRDEIDPDASHHYSPEDVCATCYGKYGPKSLVRRWEHQWGPPNEHEFKPMTMEPGQRFSAWDENPAAKRGELVQSGGSENDNLVYFVDRRRRPDENLMSGNHGDQPMIAFKPQYNPNHPEQILDFGYGLPSGHTCETCYMATGNEESPVGAEHDQHANHPYKPLMMQPGQRYSAWSPARGEWLYPIDEPDYFKKDKPPSSRANTNQPWIQEKDGPYEGYAEEDLPGEREPWENYNFQEPMEHPHYPVCKGCYEIDHEHQSGWPDNSIHQRGDSNYKHDYEPFDELGPGVRLAAFDPERGEFLYDIGRPNYWEKDAPPSQNSASNQQMMQLKLTHGEFGLDQPHFHPGHPACRGCEEDHEMTSRAPDDLVHQMDKSRDSRAHEYEPVEDLPPGVRLAAFDQNPAARRREIIQFNRPRAEEDNLVSFIDPSIRPNTREVNNTAQPMIDFKHQYIEGAPDSIIDPGWHTPSLEPPCETCYLRDGDDSSLAGEHHDEVVDDHRYKPLIMEPGQRFSATFVSDDDEHLNRAAAYDPERGEWLYDIDDPNYFANDSAPSFFGNSRQPMVDSYTDHPYGDQGNRFLDEHDTLTPGDEWWGGERYDEHNKNRPVNQHRIAAQVPNDDPVYPYNPQPHPERDTVDLDNLQTGDDSSRPYPKAESEHPLLKGINEIINSGGGDEDSERGANALAEHMNTMMDALRNGGSLEDAKRALDVSFEANKLTHKEHVKRLRAEWEAKGGRRSGEPVPVEKFNPRMTHADGQYIVPDESSPFPQSTSVIRPQGKCKNCGKTTFMDDRGDFADPRGPLGDYTADPMRASDYDMHGPDLPACFNCQNDSDSYHNLLDKGKGHKAGDKTGGYHWQWQTMPDGSRKNVLIDHTHYKDKKGKWHNPGEQVGSCPECGPEQESDLRAEAAWSNFIRSSSEETDEEFWARQPDVVDGTQHIYSPDLAGQYYDDENIAHLHADNDDDWDDLIPENMSLHDHARLLRHPGMTWDGDYRHPKYTSEAHRAIVDSDGRPAFATESHVIQHNTNNRGPVLPSEDNPEPPVLSYPWTHTYYPAGQTDQEGLTKGYNSLDRALQATTQLSLFGSRHSGSQATLKDGYRYVGSEMPYNPSEELPHERAMRMSRQGAYDRGRGEFLYDIENPGYYLWDAPPSNQASTSQPMVQEKDMPYQYFHPEEDSEGNLVHPSDASLDSPYEHRGYGLCKGCFDQGVKKGSPPDSPVHDVRYLHISPSVHKYEPFEDLSPGTRLAAYDPEREEFLYNIDDPDYFKTDPPPSSQSYARQRMVKEKELPYLDQDQPDDAASEDLEWDEPMEHRGWPACQKCLDREVPTEHPESWVHTPTAQDLRDLYAHRHRYDPIPDLPSGERLAATTR